MQYLHKSLKKLNGERDLASNQLLLTGSKSYEVGVSSKNARVLKVGILSIQFTELHCLKSVATRGAEKIATRERVSATKSTVIPRG